VTTQLELVMMMMLLLLLLMMMMMIIIIMYDVQTSFTFVWLSRVIISEQVDDISFKLDVKLLKATLPF